VNLILDGIRVLSLDPVYNLILKIVLVLTIIVLVTLNAALLFRIVRNGIEIRRARVRRRVEPRLMEYLQGDLPEEWILTALQKLPRRDVRDLLKKHFRISSGRALSKLSAIYLKLGLDAQDVRDTYSWDWWKRAAAVRRLGMLQNDAFRPSLTRCLHDSHDLVRIEAARSLALVGDPSGIDVIADMVDVPSRWQAVILAEIAQTIGAQGVDIVRGMIASDPRPAVRATAIDAVCQLTDVDAVPVLRPLLQSSEKELRIRAIKALGILGAVEVTDELTGLLQDPSWEVRSQAVKALGKVARTADPLVIDALSAAVGDPSWWVRYNAAHTLLSLGDPGAAELSRISESSPDAFARDISRQVIDQKELDAPVTVAFSRG
jgi:HEAT repeat protein